MKQIFIFITLIFAGKLVEDNLPDLHYKKLIAAFNKHVIPFLAVAYLNYLALTVKITRSPQVKKEYFELLLVLTITILLSKKDQHKKTISNIY